MWIFVAFVAATATIRDPEKEVSLGRFQKYSDLINT
jgi:hypothetical protein